MKWRRYRFVVNTVDDYRPLMFNKHYPWWCSSQGWTTDKSIAVSIIVAYLPVSEDLLTYWNDAFEVTYTEHEEIEFTDRFPKPDYYEPLPDKTT